MYTYKYFYLLVALLSLTEALGGAADNNASFLTGTEGQDSSSSSFAFIRSTVPSTTNNAHRQLFSVTDIFSYIYNLFFGTTTYCHSVGGSKYETLQTWSLFGFWHRLHGDPAQSCSVACQDLCGTNQFCTDSDYTLSQDGNTCQCSTEEDSFCGSNAQCIGGSTCTCPLGFDGDPLVSCTSQAARLAISADRLRKTYTDCTEFKEDLEVAVRYLGVQTIERNVRNYFYNDYYYGFPRGPISPIFAGGDIDAVNAPESDAGQGDGGSGGGTPITDDSYGTNLQVDGVEEPDNVKSDGTNVYVAYGLEIVVLDADQVTVLDRISLPENSDAETDNCYSGEIAGLLLIGERLVVIRSSYCGYTYAEAADAPIVESRSKTDIIIINKNDMTVIESKELTGRYISARAVENDVHLITTSQLDMYTNFLSFLNPYDVDIYGTGFDEASYRSTASEQIELNIDTFVDQFTSEFDCNALQKLTLMQNTDEILSFIGLLESMLSVNSFSVDDLAGTYSSTSILSSSSWQVTVYSSATKLILGVPGYWISDVGEDRQADQNTFIIVYDINGPTATFLSLGSVPGYLLNQFALDHAIHNGTDYVRAATSTQDQWGVGPSGNWERIAAPKNQLTVLEITSIGDDLMPVVGVLGDLGKVGERIYAVRYLGDLGFVVTYEQIDPFITMDLSNPKNPKKVGELEIPGFSNYLHPISDTLIIGVGQNAVGASTTGLQISLFDISDLAAPTRIQNYTEKGAYSEAQADHQAFRYLDDSKLLIIPVSKYNSADGFDGYVVYKIDPENGISLYMDIKHIAGDFFYGGCYSRAFLPSRTLVFAGDVMTFKAHTILSYDLTTKLADADPVDLDESLSPEDCVPCYIFEDGMFFD